MTKKLPIFLLTLLTFGTNAFSYQSLLNHRLPVSGTDNTLEVTMPLTSEFFEAFSKGKVTNSDDFLSFLESEFEQEYASQKLSKSLRTLVQNHHAWDYIQLDLTSWPTSSIIPRFRDNRNTSLIEGINYEEFEKIPVTTESREGIMDLVFSYLNGDIERGEALIMSTINTDFLDRASQSASFYNFLKTVPNLNVIDGKPVRKILNQLFKVKVPLITGSDFFVDFYQDPRAENARIFWVGLKSESDAEKLKAEVGKYQGSVEGVDYGIYQFDSSGRPLGNTEEKLYLLLDAIEASGANVLVGGVGSPKQGWIIKWVTDRNSNIKFAVGLGATGDFVIGSEKRAPKFLQNAGLEWAYRMIQDTKKINRYRSNAVFLLKNKVGAIQYSDFDL